MKGALEISRAPFVITERTRTNPPLFEVSVLCPRWQNLQPVLRR